MKRENTEFNNGNLDYAGIHDGANNGYLKQSIINNNEFICITCHRGPPYTKKYAKN